MRVALTFRAVSAIFLLHFGVATLCGQSTEFDVTSVKANRTGSGGSNPPRLQNGTLTATNVSLLMLLQVAFDMSAGQVLGPDWLDSDRYDVTGKSPQGVADSHLMPMLQALLKERFRIVAHREMREMPVYEMVVVKEGPKISPYDPAHPPVTPRNRSRGGAMIIGAGTMAQLAKMMTGPAGRPVLDKTGLEGRYTYVLTFTPLSAQGPEGVSDPAPDLFAAVQQQLGLKLVAMKDAVEILVIDHADRLPTEN